MELFDFETDKGFVHGDVKYQTEPSLSTYSRVGVYRIINWRLLWSDFKFPMGLKHAAKLTDITSNILAKPNRPSLVLRY